MSSESTNIEADVPKEEKSSFTSFIKTLASFTGDLSQLTCPGFLLCGTSILEYIGHWGDHPELFVKIAQSSDDDERIIAVTRWFVSCLYGSFRERSDGSFEKKPYNPILGEQFFCTLEKEGHKMELFSEQGGQLTKFKTTSIKIDQTGYMKIKLDNSDLTYLISLPELYYRSLYSGKPFIELIGNSYIFSSSGHYTTIKYIEKGWVSGAYFKIEGNIKDPDEKIIRELSGDWSQHSYIKDPHNSDKVTLHDVKNNPTSKRIVKPIEEQSDLESRRLWEKVTKAIEAGDYGLATKEKSEIEEKQRVLRKDRDEKGEVWSPKYFEKIEKDEDMKKFKDRFKEASDLYKDYDHHWSFKSGK